MNNNEGDSSFQINSSSFQVSESFSSEHHSERECDCDNYGGGNCVDPQCGVKKCDGPVNLSKEEVYHSDSSESESKKESLEKNKARQQRINTLRKNKVYKEASAAMWEKYLGICDDKGENSEKAIKFYEEYLKSNKKDNPRKRKRITKKEAEEKRKNGEGTKRKNLWGHISTYLRTNIDKLKKDFPIRTSLSRNALLVYMNQSEENMSEVIKNIRNMKNRHVEEGDRNSFIEKLVKEAEDFKKMKPQRRSSRNNKQVKEEPEEEVREKIEEIMELENVLVKKEGPDDRMTL